MPVQAIAENDKERDKETMTKKEYEKWSRRYERNMCPADLYDDNSFGLEDLVAPI